MTPEEQIRQLIESIGSMCEMTRLWYDGFIAQGFTEAQALYLASDQLKDMMKKNERD